jgi:serine/threonine protein kinase HipA of HipAB toxin-antitoxin module
MMDDAKTLGQRFRQQVAQWVMGNGDGVPFPAPGELDRLESYADACERLARAVDALGLRICDDEPSGVETNAALAAYREAVARG